MTYIETAADHAMSGFLADMTPGRADTDLTSRHSAAEWQRARFLKAQDATFVAEALRVSREAWEDQREARKRPVTVPRNAFNDRQIEIAIRALEAQERRKK